MLDSAESSDELQAPRATYRAGQARRTRRIDAKLWRAHREACRFARLRPNTPNEHGHLVHRQGGGWAFHYDSGTLSDDVGFHFADERFVADEYISISEGGRMHTYRVVSASHL